MHFERGIYYSCLVPKGPIRAMCVLKGVRTIIKDLIKKLFAWCIKKGMLTKAIILMGVMTMFIRVHKCACLF